MEAENIAQMKKFEAHWSLDGNEFHRATSSGCNCSASKNASQSSPNDIVEFHILLVRLTRDDLFIKANVRNFISPPTD